MAADRAGYGARGGGAPLYFQDTHGSARAGRIE
jgi:hypothetical protein